MVGPGWLNTRSNPVPFSSKESTKRPAQPTGAGTLTWLNHRGIQVVDRTKSAKQKQSRNGQNPTNQPTNKQQTITTHKNRKNFFFQVGGRHARVCVCVCEKETSIGSSVIDIYKKKRKNGFGCCFVVVFFVDFLFVFVFFLFYFHNANAQFLLVIFSAPVDGERIFGGQRTSTMNETTEPLFST